MREAPARDLVGLGGVPAELGHEPWHLTICVPEASNVTSLFVERKLTPNVKLSLPNKKCLLLHVENRRHCGTGAGILDPRSMDHEPLAG